MTPQPQAGTETAETKLDAALKAARRLGEVDGAVAMTRTYAPSRYKLDEELNVARADLLSHVAAKDAALTAKAERIARLEFALSLVHDLTEEAVGAAMLNAWNEICSDTGCHPLDIERRGGKLYFSPRHWARFTSRELLASAKMDERLTAQAAAISELVKGLRNAQRALQPLDTQIYNDNGDLTVASKSLTSDEVIAGYFAYYKARALIAKHGGAYPVKS